MRTFVAVNLPETVRAQIGQHLDNFRPLADHITWVPPGNAHVTVKFLGEVPEKNLGGVCDAIKTALIGHRRFPVRLGGFGAFPDFRRPRVFWVGITGGIDPLRALVLAVEDQLASLGFEREGRKFSAHITLGRIKRPGNYDLLHTAAQNTQYTSEPFTVSSVEVMKSVLSPQGAQYSVFESFSLEG